MTGPAPIETAPSLLDRGRDLAFDAFDFAREKTTVVALASAVAVGSLFIGVTKANSKSESPTSDLIGPQVQLVCAYPKDAPNCDINSVEQIGQQMQNYMGSPNHGFTGLSVRLSEQGGNISVLPIQLDASTSEVLQMANTSRYQSQDAPGNILDYIRAQVKSKLSTDPNTEYDVTLTNVNGLNNVDACSGGGNWAGINNGENVNLFYLDHGCTAYNYPTYSNSLIKPAVFEIEEFLHNDGYLHSCSTGFTLTGYSSEPNDLMGPNIIYNFDQTHLGKWFKSTPSCPGADVDPRLDWQLTDTSNGQGKFEFFVKDASGNLKPITPDSGNRLEAGQNYEARYVPAKNEKLISFAGSCTGQVCDFEANQPIDIQANVKQVQPPKKHLSVKEKGVKVSGKGIHCPGDCQEMLPMGAKEKLTAAPNHKGAKVTWKNCGSVIKNVCTVVMNKNKTVTATAR